MPRSLKLTAVGLAAFALVAGIVLAVFVRSLDLEPYAQRVTEAVRQATGRELRLGRLHLELLPGPTLVAEDVAFGNAPWGSRPAMVTAKRLEARIALLPLLSRKVTIARLELVEPDVLLETDAKGGGNWEFQAHKPAATSAGESSAAGVAFGGIREVRIDHGRLAYRERRQAEPTVLAIERLRLRESALATADQLDVAATFRGQPFTLHGDVGPVERLLGKEGPWPLDIAFETAGARATVDGVIDLRAAIPTFEGQLKAEIKDTTGIARLADGEIRLPVPATLAAKAKASRGGFLVEPLKATLGKSTLDGRVQVERAGERPRVTASLRSAHLDLAAVSPDARKAAARRGGRGDGRVFSDTPFPLDTLRNIDGDADVAIDRLVLPSRLVADNVKAKMVLKAGRLEVEPLAATVGGGAISGRLALDAARGRAPALSVRVEGSRISMEQAAAAAGYAGSLRGGSLDVAIRLNGTGESVRRFMATSGGEIRAVVTGPMQISGAALDFGGDALTKIADTVNPYRRTEKSTVTECMVVRLPVRDGIATANRTIAAETNRLDVVAAGSVDFRTEALDLAIRPTVKEGLGIGAASLAELVKVTGTLGNPSMGIDTLGSARTALSIGGAIATGGLSLLGESILRKQTADPHPCRTALAGGTPPPQPARQEKKEGGGLFDPIRRLFN